MTSMQREPKRMLTADQKYDLWVSGRAGSAVGVLLGVAVAVSGVRGGGGLGVVACGHEILDVAVPAALGDQRGAPGGVGAQPHRLCRRRRGRRRAGALRRTRRGAGGSSGRALRDDPRCGPRPRWRAAAWPTTAPRHRQSTASGQTRSRPCNEAPPRLCSASGPPPAWNRFRAPAAVPDPRPAPPMRGRVAGGVLLHDPALTRPAHARARTAAAASHTPSSRASSMPVSARYAVVCDATCPSSLHNVCCDNTHRCRSEGLFRGRAHTQPQPR